MPHRLDARKAGFEKRFAELLTGKRETQQDVSDVVNAILAVPVALSAVRLLSSDAAVARRPRLDIAGTLTASTGLFALVYGFSNAETHSWSATAIRRGVPGARYRPLPSRDLGTAACCVGRAGGTGILRSATRNRTAGHGRTTQRRAPT